MKRVVILGSTGVVGRAAIEVLSETHEIVGLGAYSNGEELLAQGRRFPKARLALVHTLPGRSILEGEEGLSELVLGQECDLVIVALAGIAGLLPTMKALEAGKEVLIASKEVLVAGGSKLQKLAQQPIVPLDTELLGVRDCLRGREVKDIVSMLLPASGGPFWKKSRESLSQVTVEEALLHPTCRVGKKPAVDSALLLNKGFELIAAHLLFKVPPERMEVVIHPQSIMQCSMSFHDGAVVAALMPPRVEHALLRALDLPVSPFSFDQASLDFLPLDKSQFPCLELAREALRLGDSALFVLVVAAEELVNRFLKREIPYNSVAPKLEKLLLNHTRQRETSLTEIISLAASVKEEATYA